MTKDLRNSILVTATLIAGTLATAGPARADIDFYSGIHGGNEGAVNVLFNGVDDILGPAKLVQGHIQAGPEVDLIAGQDLMVSTRGATGVMTADSAAFLDYIRILLPSDASGFFTKAIFNLDAARDGDVTITALTVDGGNVKATFDLDRNGSNFFTVLSNTGERFKEIDIASSAVLKGVGQLRVGVSTGGQILDAAEVAIAPVPEPTSLALFGTGVAGFVLLLCRRGRARKS